MLLDQNQNNSITSAPAVTPVVAPLVIHTMPDKYMPAALQKKTAKPLSGLWKWAIIGILFIGLVGGGTYAFLKFYVEPQNNPQPAPAPTPTPTSTPALNITTSTPPISAGSSTEQSVQGEITNLGNLVTAINLRLPAGALSSTETAISVFGQLIEGGTDPTFEIIGGTYTFTPENLDLLKPATLVITYQENVVLPAGESYLRLGYFAGGAWHSFENSQVDATQNIVSVSFNTWPGRIFTLLIAKDIMATLKPQTQLLNQDNITIDNKIVRSLDGDKDGLSDVEEALYKSDPQIYDTDKDSYNDGMEVGQLYSPLTGPETTLLNDKLAVAYTNTAGKYSLQYPAGFKISGASSTAGDPVTFISPDSTEMFTVSVQPNPQNMTAAEWYLKQNATAPVEELRQLSVNGVGAIWSVSGKEIYLSRQQKIYAIAYNTTTKSSADFVASFEMLIRGFKIMD